MNTFLSKLLSVIFFTLASACPVFSWTLIDESATGNKIYIDWRDVRKLNSLVYFWQLTSLQSPSSTTLNWLSKISYQRVNCANMESQALFDYFYDGKMGDGKFLLEIISPEENWYKLEKNSIGSYVASTICSNSS